MAVINAGEKGIGMQIRGKLGKPGAPDPLGVYGIYRVQSRYNKQSVEKMPFYTPTNPQTPAQQNQRAKLTAGVIAWQGLTTNQKNVYNQRAKYKPLSGFNLYLREYLLSH